jgi:putative endonuclease
VLDTGLGFLGAANQTVSTMKEKGGWLYIMANRYRGGMYVGVSSHVIRRVHQHREGTGSTHVADFGKTRLVYVEHHEEILLAIAREKLVKKWRREWKFALIEKNNPDWLDLWDIWFPDNDLPE